MDGLFSTSVAAFHHVKLPGCTCLGTTSPQAAHFPVVRYSMIFFILYILSNLRLRNAPGRVAQVRIDPYS